MRARTYAAKFATGDIMVYLDSHCEVYSRGRGGGGPGVYFGGGGYTSGGGGGGEDPLSGTLPWASTPKPQSFR